MRNIKFVPFVFLSLFILHFQLISYSDCGHCDEIDAHSPKGREFIELKKLERKVENILYLNSILNKLYLSPEQTKLFYELIKRIDREKMEMLQKMRSVLKEQVKYYTKFKEEAMKNEGFTVETERNTASTEYKGKQLHDKFTLYVNKCEKELYNIFLPEQIQLLQFILCPEKREERKNQLLNPLEWQKIKLQEELKKIDKKHPKPGFFSEFMKNEDLPSELAKRVGVTYESFNHNDEEFEKLHRKVKDLASDINLLNLLNGINFNKHQLKHIIKYSKEYNAPAEIYLEDPLENFTLNSLKRFKKSLLKIVDNLKEDTNEKNLEKAFKELENIRKQFRERMGVNKVNKKDKNKPKVECIDGVFEILFNAQKEVLYNYNPCLIPPKNLKDPVRVGQAKDVSQQERKLENFRSIPQDKWQSQKFSILDKTIAEIERKVELTSKEKKEFKEKLLEVIEKVRAMSDVDFELEKKEIAKELAFLDKVEILKEELKKLSGKENVVCDKIKQFLLTPRIIPLAEERLKQMKQKQDAKQTNLDTLKSPAEKCRDGNCAIKD